MRGVSQCAHPFSLNLSLIKAPPRPRSLLSCTLSFAFPLPDFDTFNLKAAVPSSLPPKA